MEELCMPHDHLQVAFRIGSFDYVQGTILIPEDSIWYRAYNPTLPRLGSSPLFFGDMEVAHMYAKQSVPQRALGEFRAKKQLQVMDMRYMMSLMGYLVRFMTDYPHLIQKIMMALGIGSLQRQITLWEAYMHQHGTEAYPQLPSFVQRMRDFAALPPGELPSWANPLELHGVRAGVTDLDYELMQFCKVLLPIDGILAPALPTPFHDQMHTDVRHSVLMEELILFDPAVSLEWVRDRPVRNRVEYFVRTIHFQRYIEDRYTRFVDSLRPPRIRVGSSHGGSSRPLEVRDAYAEALQRDPVLQKKFLGIMKDWRALAKHLHKKVPSLAVPMVCVPTLSPSMKM